MAPASPATRMATIGCSMATGLASAPRRHASRPTNTDAKAPRTSMTCAMFIDSEENLVIASFRVKPTMATIMNSAPRRFGERGKGVSGFYFRSLGRACSRQPENSNGKEMGHEFPRGP